MIPNNYTTGEYAVGTCTFSLTDDSRQDTLGNGGARRIAVRMYYPVNKDLTEGAKKARAISERKKKAVLKSMAPMIKLPDEMIFPEHYDLPMTEEKRFPLIMFSHGYGSYAEANTFLCCDIASHGYIIASLGHANEAIENDYEDGYDLFDKKISKMMYDKNIIVTLIAMNRIKNYKSAREKINAFDDYQNKYNSFIRDRVKEWAADTVFAADTVKKRFAHHIDLSAGIGAGGHSLGGCTAYYLCRNNSDFSCGINIDGALFGEYNDSIMTKPFCQISCRENIFAELRPFLDTSADTYQVIFDDMKHIGFSDVKYVYPFRSVCGKLDDEVLHKNLAYSHYAFFDKYLKGKDIFFGRKEKKVHYVKIRGSKLI